MKTGSRKFMAYLLVLMLICSNLTVPAFAEETAVSTVPETTESVSTLTLPANLRVIEEEAFYGNTSISRVVVPAGATTIESHAFAYSSLTEIVLPATLSSIADNAFDGCGEFTVSAEEGSYAYEWAVGKGYIEESTATPAEYFTTEPLEDGTLAITGYTGSDTDVIIPAKIGGVQVTKIGDNAFANSILTSIIIPEGVTSIGFYAFSWSWNLTSVELPSTLKELDNYCFNQCNLNEINLPEGLVTISDGAFGGNNNISPIYIPASVTYIGDAAFYGNGSLKSIILADENTAYRITDNILFSADGSRLVLDLNAASRTSYTVPAGVTRICDYAFAEAKNMTEIILPDTLESIGDCAFSRCSSLQAVELPAGCITLEGNAFEQCTSLTEIILPEGLTHINWATFSGCTSLETMVLPQSIQSIENTAFNNCSALKTINLPDTIWYIGDSAFNGCSNVIPAVSSGSYAEQWCIRMGVRYAIAGSSSLLPFTYLDTNDGRATITGYTGLDANVVIPSAIDGLAVNAIGDGVFMDNASITSVVIPAGVAIIGENAFRGCGNLTSVSLPDSLYHIGAHAFQDCMSLTEIDLPGGLMYAGPHAFAYCYSLRSIDIPESLTELSDTLFGGCGALTSVTLHDSLYSINAYAFDYCTALTEITLTRNIGFIDPAAFANCPNLTFYVPFGTYASHWASSSGVNYVVTGAPAPTATPVPTAVPTPVVTPAPTATPVITPAPTPVSDFVVENGVLTAYNGAGGDVVIPSNMGITSIGLNAFGDNSAIRSVYIPEGVTHIGDYAFRGCSSLTSVSLPSTIIVIGSWSFGNCYALTNLAFHDGLGSIGSFAFANCQSLASITLPSTVYFFGSIPFTNCPNLTATVTSGSYAETYCISNHISYTIADAPTASPFTYTDTHDGRATITGYTGRDSNVVIPSAIDGLAVNAIGDGVFMNNTSITSVVIPAGVAIIGENAFRGCGNLTSVSLPDSLYHIGAHAFQDCMSLTEIDLPGGLMYAGPHAFAYCYSLRSIDIPESLTELSDTLFGGCGALTSVTLHDSLYSINAYAFDYCTALTEITLTRNIGFIDPAAFANCPNLTFYVPFGTYASHWASSSGVNYVVTGAPEAESSIRITGVKEKYTYLYNGKMSFYSIGDIYFKYSDPGLNLASCDITAQGDACASIFAGSIPSDGSVAALMTSFIKEGVTTYTITATDTSGGVATAEFELEVIQVATTTASIINPDNSAALYDAPSTSGKVIRWLADGMEVDVISNDGEWAYIMLSYGLAGYVKSQYLPDASSTPTPDVSAFTYKAISGTAAEITSYSGSAADVVIPDSIDGLKVTRITDALFLNNTSIKSVIIPEGVTTIGAGLFQGCTNLTRAVLPSTLQYVSYSAFNQCSSLTEVVLPEGIPMLYGCTFYDCSSLKQITLPSTIKEIWSQAFDGCTSLTDIVIPESVTSIPMWCFSDCTSLKSLVIPKSVQNIHAEAFRNCPNLTLTVTPGSYAETWCIAKTFPYTTAE